jgi:hypothetical protein
MGRVFPVASVIVALTPPKVVGTTAGDSSGALNVPDAMFVPKILTREPGATGGLKLPAETIVRACCEQTGKFDAVTTNVTFSVDGATVM